VSASSTAFATSHSAGLPLRERTNCQIKEPAQIFLRFWDVSLGEMPPSKRMQLKTSVERIENESVANALYIFVGNTLCWLTDIQIRSLTTI
jgi:hypothetical protein